MKNSTFQKMHISSNKLSERSFNTDHKFGKLSTTSFITHDFNNLYRTSYNDMGGQKVKNLL
jgi:hypothetical protein